MTPGITQEDDDTPLESGIRVHVPENLLSLSLLRVPLYPSVHLHDAPLSSSEEFRIIPPDVSTHSVVANTVKLPKNNKLKILDFVAPIVFLHYKNYVNSCYNNLNLCPIIGTDFNALHLEEGGSMYLY